MSPLNIVLIEDNAPDVFLVEMALKQAGIPYSLTHFENGSDALESLSHRQASTDPLPDAILMDLNTPRTDGLSVLAALKHSEDYANVPMAVITSSQSPEDKRQAAMYGARFFLKPSRLQEFLNSVGEAVKEMVHERTA